MAPIKNFGNIGLSITGIGIQYPPHKLKPESLEIISKRFYPDSPSMAKVLAINRFTGIQARSSIGTHDHYLVNQIDPPTIAELHQVFLSDGVPLAVSASRKAIEEAGIDLSEITHIVSTTCTDSSNPGFDHFVAKELGIKHQVEKVLLHGVGCSGGLAAIRTAAGLALGNTAMGRPARILCIALEVSTTLVRSELDSINDRQETRIGVALFSDCASAVVLSNGVGEVSRPIYKLLGWNHKIIPNSDEDLAFDVDKLGWKVVLTPRVPRLACGSIDSTFQELLSMLPQMPSEFREPHHFDWAMHPGGATILTGAEKTLGIQSEHMRASYDVYMNHGNSSSATIFSVMDRLRTKDMDEMAPGGSVSSHVVGCAFGPGISVEMCMLERNLM